MAREQISLAVAHASFAFATPILTDVTLTLGPAWHGLVGANGAGKTTFLRLILGELEPEGGSLRWAPERARIVLCPQRVDVAGDDVLHFAGDDGAHARRLRARLALDGAGLARWAMLSPGERKRWQIGAALREDPDVLLLDEPTNHIDASARTLLVEALRAFRGLGVVVSHDRALLETLTSVTLRLDRRTLRAYPGNFTAAKAQWELEERRAMGEHDEARELARAAKRHLVDVRREHEAADRSRSMRAKSRDKNDHDARSFGRKIRIGWAEDRLGRRGEVARRAAEKAADAVPEVERMKSMGRSIFMGYERAHSPQLAAITGGVTLHAGVRELLRDVSVVVRREDRIAIRGDNGAGKSTLLRALLASSTVPRERLFYLPQDLDEGQGSALLAETMRLEPAERGRVLSLVAALGVDPERLLASRAPSPGEARKVAIAWGLGRHAWGALLDEPTNHLDLPSIERLEKALAAYPGTLVLVTHDQDLARACTHTTWHIENRHISTH
ncbi:ATP-binding cassette domain-containing protein [Pendulispora rubella]|uniref:ATP-binding cassette domain-containing protein n=1 Tax=Pendulispora rubella TaxID=2741070 RepID=A0ABZ2KPQ8_9BACT